MSGTAVVIGLDSTTGLQSARILAGEGISVIGITSDMGHPCARTNVCQRILKADTGSSELIEALLLLAPVLDERAVIFPCTDLSVLLVSRHRSELEPAYALVLPDAETIELLVDKERFYSYAQSQNLPIPLTFFLRTKADVLEAANALRFPCIVKPALKTPLWKQRSGEKAYSVVRREDLMALYQRVSGWTDTLIAQNFIAGPDRNHFTCNCYFDAEGAPLLTFTSRKLRQWPPTGGEGCLSEESTNEVVETETVRLFTALHLRGLGYLEMKRDEATGEYLIIEPNVGRPTGRSACAEKAGVPLLHTMYCDALGLPLPVNRRKEHTGVKWIHSRRDFQSVLYHMRRGDLSLRECIRSWRGPKVDALFNWRDPVPFLADAARVMGRLHERKSGTRSTSLVATEAAS